MTQNVDELRRLMAAHHLTRARVAELTRSAVSTVDAWLAPPDAAWARPMPDGKLELLTLKLAAP